MRIRARHRRRFWVTLMLFWLGPGAAASWILRDPESEGEK